MIFGIGLIICWGLRFVFEERILFYRRREGGFVSRSCVLGRKVGFITVICILGEN